MISNNTKTLCVFRKSIIHTHKNFRQDFDVIHTPSNHIIENLMGHFEELDKSATIEDEILSEQWISSIIIGVTSRHSGFPNSPKD